MNKKKIVFVINDVLPGGAQRVVYDIARHLDTAKFSPYVIALRTSEQTGNKGGDLLPLFKEKNIPVHIMGWQGHPSLSDFKKLMYVMKEISPDIVHSHLPYSVIIGTIAAKLAGVKKIVAHEHNTHEFDPWKIRVGRYLVSFFIDIVVCYTDIVEQSLYGKVDIFESPSQFPNAKIPHSITIFNGIDVKKMIEDRSRISRESKRASLGISPNDILVLAVGRFISWKGHAHLIRTCAQVVKRMPRIKLCIVGYGPLFEECEELIRTLEVSDSVKLLGLRTDAFELMCAADIISNVYTYDTDTKVKEGLGIAGLEALGSGTATIVGYYPSVDKFISEKETCFVDPYSEKELSTAIERLALDPDQRVRLGASAQARVLETLDWSIVSLRYQNLYDYLLHQ